MTAYYNEFDPYAAQWLRNLIESGNIAPGVVDERSIEDVHPSDLRGFTQCHFFAGIGAWSLALRRAGWPDDRPVWTGSCPCQPFSAAGAGAGFEDPRHLWPTFAWIIKQRKPPVIFGEQVASKAVEPWVDLVHADLEALGYAFGGVPFPSSGVGAPHIRDRLFWVAESRGERREWGQRSENRGFSDRHHAGRIESNDGASGASQAGVLRVEHARLDNDASQVETSSDRKPKTDGPANLTGGPSTPLGRMGYADRERVRRITRTIPGEEVTARRQVRSEPDTAQPPSAASEPGPVNGFWRAADWLGCRDDKWRPVEPGTFPLAHGAPSRVGRLRAYGNAINVEAATQFIAAYLET